MSCIRIDACKAKRGYGGIGLELQSSLNTLAWSQMSVIFLLLLGTVILSEWDSAKVRHTII